MSQFCRKLAFGKSRWCCFSAALKKWIISRTCHMICQHFCSALPLVYPISQRIHQETIRFSSHLQPPRSLDLRDSRANGSSSHGSMYLHSSSWMAQGWPDRGEAWSNSSGKTLTPRFLAILDSFMMKICENDE